MMTRKATAQNTEFKLRQTLKELKQSKETCDQLLRDREESEEEIKKIIAKNSQLKSDLAELHSQHEEVLYQREQLHNTLSSCSKEFDTYKRALQRIDDLERELSVANCQINLYAETQQLQETLHTQSLFEELMASPGTPLTPQCLISTNREVTHHPQSIKKVKKYVRISKFIKKIEKKIKRNQGYHRNITLRKEKNSLIDSLEIYSSKLN
ncbi:unnamed protein product [Diatraea saccharalis]|uniref:Uncharacterized protein n=1 Tax=Diatraea saccharalis TaxID=40085 RepID=A0A9N9WDG7_9NEOP|nr:unnamed protein product [Diatraea saccharalis]